MLITHKEVSTWMRTITDRGWHLHCTFPDMDIVYNGIFETEGDEVERIDGFRCPTDRGPLIDARNTGGIPDDIKILGLTKLRHPYSDIMNAGTPSGKTHNWFIRGEVHAVICVQQLNSGRYTAYYED